MSIRFNFIHKTKARLLESGSLLEHPSGIPDLRI
jgi:hypothetical protein